MYGYIYKFTNLTNNKIYIGKHKFDKPELDKKYITSGVLIKNAISKYGLENFNQELVCVCDSLEELNNKEIYYINYFNSKVPNGYNLTDGGDGISSPSPEIIEINRLKHLGKKQSQETINKKRESRKGYRHSEETRKRISNSNKGTKPADSTIQASIKRHKNTKWYNDGVNEFMLSDNDLRITSLNKGRLKNPFPSCVGCKKSEETKLKIGKSKSNTFWINNGICEKMIKEIDIPEGYIKGRLKKN